MNDLAPPLAVLLELTHRCPLQCPYCSNPLELKRSSAELDTVTWCRVLDEAAALGALQVHLSGGEPLARTDLETLVRHANERTLYTNLITSGVMLSETRLAALVEAGLQHVQISIQDTEPAKADRIAGLGGAHERKLAAAAAVRRAGVALTLNCVVHRHNAERVAEMISLAEALGAGRVEIAHVQYYGWALRNRAALLPTRDQLESATAAVEAARHRLGGRMSIDYVVPDYYAVRPKACMGGWARRFLNVSPEGRVLPCHAAETLPGLVFPTVHEASLGDIWRSSPAFERFRGTEWMLDPCRTCERRELDWGGCRCQAFALAGDAAAADPACALSAHHAVLLAALRDASHESPAFAYRGFSAVPNPPGN
jgi:PqqA peptide cyclase